MRGSRTTKSDRVAGSVVVLAGSLIGVFVFFVALPIAMSSPYPTLPQQDWVATQPVAAAAAVGGFQLASADPAPKLPDRFANALVTGTIADKPAAATQALAPTVRTASVIIFRRDDASPEQMGAPASAPAITDTAVPAEDVQSDPDVEAAKPSRPGSPRRDSAMTRDIDLYLWEVYQRQPVKKDRGGDFTWKDPAAAKRVGRTLQAYVILGMDADLRETLYHAGKAMDAAGIEWTIVSAFRDDWRQSIATGIKARTGYSRHGGSRATGGYGHGLAVDVGHADGKSHMAVWRWIDANGTKYGLSRPIRHFDPPHVEPRGDWRRIARNLRNDRTGVAVADAADDDGKTAGSAKARSRYAGARRTGRARR